MGSFTEHKGNWRRRALHRPVWLERLTQQYAAVAAAAVARCPFVALSVAYFFGNGRAQPLRLAYANRVLCDALHAWLEPSIERRRARCGQRVLMAVSTALTKPGLPAHNNNEKER